MSVYVDQLRPCLPNRRWRHRQSCHLTADSVAELHEFACSIGLRRRWFQDRVDFPHYDLTAGKRNAALAFGAMPIDAELMLAFARRMRP